MIVSEQEAKTKWCPETRVKFEGVAGNFHVNQDQTRCIASDCMMWVWKHHPDDDPNPAGYCGKAGA